MPSSLLASGTGIEEGPSRGAWGAPGSVAFRVTGPVAVVTGGLVVGIAAGLSPWIGVAALAGVALSLCVLARPATAGVLLVGLVPAVSGLARGLPVPGFRLGELLAVGLGLLAIIATPSGQRAPWRRFDWLALAYVSTTILVGGFDVVRYRQSLDGDALGTLLGPLQFLVLYRAALVTLCSPDHRRLALRVLLSSSAVIGLITTFQAFDVGPSRLLVSAATGVDVFAPDGIHTYDPRPTGLLPSHHALGGFMLMTTLLAVALLLEPCQRIMSRRGLLVVLALGAAAILETVTISPIVFTVFGALVLGAWYGRLWYIASRMVLVLLLGVALFGSVLNARAERQFRAPVGSSSSQSIVPQTLRYRYRVWTEQNLPALKGHWVTGFGPSLPPNLAFPYAESLYITLLFRGGLILLAVYLALLLGWVRASAARFHGANPEQRAAARAVLFSLMALTLIHFIESYFVDMGPPQVLWALTAIALAGMAPRPGAPSSGASSNRS